MQDRYGISVCNFPTHASTHFTAYFTRACLYAFHCLLSLRVPVCVCLTVRFPYVCLYAFHSALALRMPLCVSLHTFPTYACLHVVHTFPMQFIVYFPYAVELRRTRRLYRKKHFAMLSGEKIERCASFSSTGDDVSI